MAEKNDSEETMPVLEFEGVKLITSRIEPVINLKLHAGKLGFLKRRSASREILGIRDISGGEIRVFGKTWDERSVVDLEDRRSQIGTVVNPRSKESASWVTNLDVDENVTLSAEFDRKRSHASITKKAANFAKQFALDEGVPTSRPSKTPPEDLIRAQWVRAFLPEPLKVLILENPLFNAPSDSALLLAQAVKNALADDVAVLWIADTLPSFSELGMEAAFLID